SRQLSFSRMSEPSEARNCRTGSRRAAGRLFWREGPIARTITFFGMLPVTMNPPIMALSPFSMRPRVAMLSGRDGGAAVGVAVGVGAIVAVAVAVGLGVTAGVGLGVGTLLNEFRASTTTPSSRP